MPIARKRLDELTMCAFIGALDAHSKSDDRRRDIIIKTMKTVLQAPNRVAKIRLHRRPMLV